MIRYIKRVGKVWIRVFFDKFLIVKFLEMRMGKGKGFVEKWVMNIKLGRIVYEMLGIEEGLVREVLVLV